MGGEEAILARGREAAEWRIRQARRGFGGLARGPSWAGSRKGDACVAPTRCRRPPFPVGAGSCRRSQLLPAIPAPAGDPSPLQRALLSQPAALAAGEGAGNLADAPRSKWQAVHGSCPQNCQRLCDAYLVLDHADRDGRQQSRVGARHASPSGWATHASPLQEDGGRDARAPSHQNHCGEGVVVRQGDRDGRGVETLAGA